MAHPSLAGVDLRLERADKCLDLLNRLRRDFLTKRHEIVGYHDTEFDEYVFQVAGDPPPLRWGLVISEFAHCLRASLDNMLWQLILARTGTEPRGKPQFPVYEHRTDRRGNSNTAKAETATLGVLPDDFALIEAYQPYNVRDDPNLTVDAERDIFVRYQPLAMLAHLNNVDKHRYLFAGFAAARGVSILYGPMKFTPVLFVTNRQYVGWSDRDTLPIVDTPPQPGLLYDERRGVSYEGWWSSSDDDPTEIARAFGGRTPPGEKPEVKMYSRPPLEISFSDARRPMTIFDFRDIRSEVVGIIEHFRPVIG